MFRRFFHRRELSDRSPGNKRKRRREEWHQNAARRLRLETLEERRLLAAIDYNAVADRLTFTTASGNTDVATFSSPGTNQVRIQVVDTITLQGGAAGNPDFVLTDAGKTLTINAAGANSPISEILAVADTSASTTFLGTIQNATGPLSLTKDGSGTLTLTGNGTYTGVTTVTAGKLLVNGSLADGASTNDVVVQANATLGGSGTIQGKVQVAVGGHLAPGASPGIETFANLEFSSGAVFDVEIGGNTPGNHDQAIVSGAVSLNNATLNLTQFNGYLPFFADEFILIQNTGFGAISGIFDAGAGSNLPAGTDLTEGSIVSGSFLGSGRTARITYMGGDGNDVAIVMDNGTVTFSDDDGQADDWTIRVAGNNFQVLNGTTVVSSRPLAGGTGISINGEFFQNDKLTIDFTNGSPIPFFGGISFDGGFGGNDELVLEQGFSFGTFFNIAHDFSDGSSGGVTFDFFSSISYTNVESISDNLSALSRDMNFGFFDETITLSNIVDVNGTQMNIDSDVGGPSLNFANPFQSLTIRGGIGNDLIRISSLDGAFAAPLAVDGGAGSADAIELNVTGLSTQLHLTGVNNGRWSFTNGTTLLTYTSMENVQTGGTGVYDLILDTVAFGIGGNGTADTLDARLNAAGTQLELRANATLSYAGAKNDIRSLTMVGSTDADTATVTETAGGLPGFVGPTSAGHVSTAFTGSGRTPTNAGVHFNGGAGSANDQMSFQFTTARDVAYFSDTDDTANSGVVNVLGASTISFESLTPLTFAGAGGTLTVDATSTPGSTFLTVADTAGTGISQVTGDGGFETTTFSGFDSLVVRGGSGSELITLDSVDAADPNGAPGGPAALTSITLNGDNTTNNDNSSDTFDILALPSSISLTVRGDDPANATGASDTVTIGNQTVQFNSVFDGNLDNIDGPLTITGGAGTGDVLNVDDSADATGDTGANAGVLTNSALTGLDMSNGIASYTTVESFNLLMGAGGDTLNVRSSAAGVLYALNTDQPSAAGDDVINISSDAALNTGTLNGIDGQLNFNTRGGTDTLNLSDLGDAAGDTYVLSVSGTATQIEFANGSGDGAATPDIRFNVSAAAQLEHFTITAGNGSDTITNATANGGTRLAAGMLAGTTNTFSGSGGNDTFTFEWSSGFNLPVGTGFAIHGGTSVTRDVANLRTDAAGDGPRTIGLTYADNLKTSGDVDVTGLRAGGGVVDVNAVEQLNYVGDTSNNDAITITGTTANDILSITPLSASRANVFLDGNPMLLPNLVPPTNNNPGVAGGSVGPDISLVGIRPQDDGTSTPSGLSVSGSGGNNRLVVNASTESNATVGALAGTSGWGGNAFGSGSAVRTDNEAFDDITVTDSRVRILRRNASGTLLESLVDVNIATPSFNGPSAIDAELTVNAGEEVGVRATNVADDVTVTLSTIFHFQVNGGFPAPTSGILRGDRLNVNPLPGGTLDLFSDIANPPNVSVRSTAGLTQSQPAAG